LALIIGNGDPDFFDERGACGFTTPAMVPLSADCAGTTVGVNATTAIPATTAERVLRIG
jgi:hypothetical protein